MIDNKQYLKKLEELEKLNSFQTEYLNRNFLFKGWRFRKPVTIMLSDDNITLLSKQGQEVQNTITIVGLIGETSEYYHVSTATKTLFLKRDFDLYKRVWESNTNIDFKKLNQSFKYTLDTYQETGVEFLCYNNKAILCDTAGLGKTFTSIGAAVQMKYKKVLVVCLANIKPNWKNELEVWGKTGTIIGENSLYYCSIKVDTKEKAETLRVKFNRMYLNEQCDTIKNKLESGVLKLNTTLPKDFTFDRLLNNYSKWSVQIIKSKSKGVESFTVKFNLENPYDYSNQDVVFDIINFDIIDKYQHKIKKNNYDCVIIDEAHKVKHPKSNRVKALKNILTIGSLKSLWVMTATPFEKNNELYSLLTNVNFNSCELVPSSNSSWNIINDSYHNFLDNFVETEYQKIYRRTNGEVKVKEVRSIGRKIDGELIVNKNTEALGQIMRRFMLRRLKEEEIKDFPQVFFEHMSIVINEKQREKLNCAFYDYLVKALREKEIKNSEYLIEKLEEYKGDKEAIFKKISNHINYSRNKKTAELEIANNKQKTVINEELDFLEEFKFMMAANKVVSASLDSILTAEYKIKDTLELIKDRIKEGKKVLVFTTKIIELEILNNELKKAKIETFAITKNENSPQKKENKKNEFQDFPGPCVLVGNIVAMGTGLNIQAADVVIFNSVPWSWDLIEQAYSRAWRRGRKGDVMVYFMVVDGTVDNVMLARAFSKRDNTHSFFVE
jgi:SNF2 family DNA or RNA helicase